MGKHHHPVPPSDYAIGVSVRDSSGNGLGHAIGKLILDEDGSTILGKNDNGRISFYVPAKYHKGWGSWLQIDCLGYTPYRQRIPVQDGSYDVTLQLAFPARPSRDELLAFQCTAQGLLVNIPSYGMTPIYEPGYQCLSDPLDRAAWRKAKKDAGDTHLILVYSTHEGYIYHEDQPANFYESWITKSAENEPDWFLGLVEEVRKDGFIPCIAYDGDNGDNPADGYPNALRQLPLLRNLLQTSQYDNLNKHCIFLRFWDGVFYGSSPENIENFGTEFGKLYTESEPLGIEFSTGHIPTGDGGADYAPGGKMDRYDLVFAEFNNLLPRTDDPNPDTNPGSSIWQVIGRLATPYIRPADQPPSTDVYPPPFYLVDSSRGYRVAIAFEYGIYPFVRIDLNNPQPLIDIINNNRAYLKTLSTSPNYRVS